MVSHYEFSDSQPSMMSEKELLIPEVVVEALDLADAIDSSDTQPTQQQVRVTIHPDIIATTPQENWPECLSGLIHPHALGIEALYHWQHPTERPDLGVHLFDETRGELPVATLTRNGGQNDAEADFNGTFMSGNNHETALSLSNDELAILLEAFISPKDYYRIDENGVSTLPAELIKEIIADAQHPPVARFIQDTLVEKGSLVIRTNLYSIKFGDEAYNVEIIRENNTVQEIDLVEILSDTIEVTDGELVYHQHGIGAHISAADNTMDIVLFTQDNNIRQNLAIEDGDVYRLQEKIRALLTYFLDQHSFDAPDASA